MLWEIKGVRWHAHLLQMRDRKAVLLDFLFKKFLLVYIHHTVLTFIIGNLCLYCREYSFFSYSPCRFSPLNAFSGKPQLEGFSMKWDGSCVLSKRRQYQHLQSGRKNRFQYAQTRPAERRGLGVEWKEKGVRVALSWLILAAA